MGLQARRHIIPRFANSSNALVENSARSAWQALIVNSLACAEPAPKKATTAIATPATPLVVLMTLEVDWGGSSPRLPQFLGRSSVLLRDQFTNSQLALKQGIVSRKERKTEAQERAHHCASNRCTIVRRARKMHLAPDQAGIDDERCACAG